MTFPLHFIAATRDYADKIEDASANWPERYTDDLVEFADSVGVRSAAVKPVPAPYLRRSFSLDELPGKADFLITATGFYELFVNGRWITKGLLAPYISNPDQILFYDAYDLLPFLREGENVIGLWLGNGFANTPGGRWVNFHKALHRGAPAAAASLDMGDTVIETDEDFKIAPSPIYFDDYRGGEYYDARNIIPGWAEPGFDDSGWARAIQAPPARGKAVLNAADPIVVTQELRPVSFKPVNGGYLYDFGVNLSGVCRLKIKGEPGQKIILNHGEHLLPDGSLNLWNISFSDDDYIQKDIFICSGGEDTWTPTFVYHGFRYVWARGMTPGQATPDALTYLVFNTDLKERSGFACSDAAINALQEMTRRSDLSNFHHFPTDCPHREKMGWTADAALSAEHMLLNLTPERNFRQWLHCIRMAQRDDGALPGFVPGRQGGGFDWGNGPAWDCVLVWLPYYVYLYRGDRAILEENAHAILGYLEFLGTKIREDGLVAFGLGDWCPAGEDDAGAHKSPLAFTDTVTSMDICEKAAYIFDTLGKPLHAQFARGLQARFRYSRQGNADRHDDHDSPRGLPDLAGHGDFL